MITSSNPLAELETAILQEEGTLSGKSAGIPLNNPFNLTDGQGNLLSFTSPAAGMEAGQNYIESALSGENQNYAPGESLGAFESTYTGGDPNAGYNLGKMLSVEPETTPASNYANGAGLVNPSNTAASNAQTLPEFFQQILHDAEQSAATGGAGMTEGRKHATFTIPSLTDGVAILAGLVLLAGGIWGFKGMSSTTVQVGSTIYKGIKKGKSLAAKAAETAEVAA